MEFIYTLCVNASQMGILPSSFEHAFMARALVATMLVSPMLGGAGTLIMAKRMMFFSQTISHASLTGVALGLLIGEPPGATYAGVYGFCLISALLMMYIKHQTRASFDTVIGVVLAQILGVGIIALVMVTRQFNIHQIEALLFGSLITISDQDLLILMVTLALTAVILLMTYNRSMLIGFNPLLAKAHGTRTVALEYLFVIIITLIIVASLKIMGALLVLALIVIPSAASQNLSCSMTGFFWISAGIALFSGVSGLMLSAIWPVPTGGAIVLVASVLFYGSFLIRFWVGRTSFSPGNHH